MRFLKVFWRYWVGPSVISVLAFIFLLAFILGLAWVWSRLRR
jgi:flagellar biogenesis protein FliO